MSRTAHSGLALLASALLSFASGALAQQYPFPLPPKDWPSPVMDTQPFTFLLLDRFEYRAQKGNNAVTWDAQAWFGGDYNKLWIKSEGEYAGGRTESADAQVLYARRIAPLWHVQAGLREEARPKPSQTYGVLALQGIAPLWFNVEASAFFRSGGMSGSLEAEYDQYVTQRLVLQPRVETNFSGYSDPARGVGSGFNDVSFGLRLRYEIKREIAPYIGVTWTRRLGNTADLARAAGEDVGQFAIVAGIRLWY